MKNEFVKLNGIIELTNGGHIFYPYEDINCYVNNAVSYIVSGIEQKHHVLLIDSQERWSLIYEKLKNALSEKDLAMIHYMDNFEFYGMNGDFDAQIILNHFAQIIEPFFANHISIRTWVHVDWNEQDNIVSLIKEYENREDFCVRDTRLVSVRAFNSQTLTVPLQLSLMRIHEYLLTDHEFVCSCLFNNTSKTVIFPSLSVQTKMQSEMDLYKQKLDFVHVVSHEVRNPLTVIKAYCTMMLDQNSDFSEENLVKIRGIRDYVDVIDNEMNHIIHTEQMLANDLLWKKEIVDPLPVIQDVIEFMSIKARTQHIQLQYKSNLTGREKLITNKIGLRLVLSNLISNAIKYSQEQAIVIFSVLAIHDKIIFKVKDQGVGMTEEQVNKLFEKYGKLNYDKSGMGIGLYMVKKLVDHFEGSIQIDSWLDKGTLVIVALPRC